MRIKGSPTETESPVGSPLDSAGRLEERLVSNPPQAGRFWPGLRLAELHQTGQLLPQFLLGSDGFRRHVKTSSFRKNSTVKMSGASSGPG